jgi:hypothetical protein
LKPLETNRTERFLSNKRIMDSRREGRTFRQELSIAQESRQQKIHSSIVGCFIKNIQCAMLNSCCSTKTSTNKKASLIFQSTKPKQ